MRTRWLVLLGVAAFLWTALLHAPADRLYAAITARGEPSAVALHGVHGTVSQGGFAGASLNGRPMLQAVEWELQPAWLLLLRLSANLELRGDPQVTMTVSRGVFGRLRLSDTVAGGSLKGMLATLGAPPLPMEGQVRLVVNSAQLADGLLLQVDGLAEFNGLVWTLAREPMVLGDYNANLATDDKGVLAQLASTSGPLEVSGEARLMPDQNWELQLQVKPRPGASPPLLALVRSMGNPDSAGWYHLRQRGTL